MSAIAENIIFLKKSLPASVRLVAVSKTKPVSDILSAYEAGQRLFGENRVQEILAKKDNLPGDIEWHLIGHLQTNKVKTILPYVSMIESVDTEKLLLAINSEAKKINRIIDCLLQIHIAAEESKFGFSADELTAILSPEKLSLLNNVRICGLMGMATFTDDSDQIRREFRNLSQCFNVLKNKYFAYSDFFSEKSMGMSGDYKIAIEEGSTIVRVGSLIFGERIKK
jgi:PLP dependent protein